MRGAGRVGVRRQHHKERGSIDPFVGLPEVLSESLHFIHDCEQDN